MRFAICLALAFTGSACVANAASLQVSPVLVEVAAPGATATITVRNDGTAPLAAQLRIFRWSQVDGEERLEPTEDVVASPPAVELRPQQDYVVRIVRTAKQPVVGEESYRLLVDELPDAQLFSGVKLVVRHSLPVFFDAPDAQPAEPAWALAQTGRGLTLRVANHGDRRVRLSAVKIADGAGRTLAFDAGLVGYALGRSTMSFPTKVAGLAPKNGAKISIRGNTEQGSFSATAVVQATR
jgi:fimbrial chaperone protein